MNEEQQQETTCANAAVGLEEVTGPSTLTRLDRRIALSLEEEPSDKEKQRAVRAAAARRQRTQERTERRHRERHDKDPVGSPSSELVILEDVEEPPLPPSARLCEGQILQQQQEGEGFTISTAPDGSPLSGDSTQPPGAYRVRGDRVTAARSAGEQDNITTTNMSSTTGPYHAVAVLVDDTEPVQTEAMRVETDPVLEETETGRDEEIHEMRSMIRKDRRLLLCMCMTVVVLIVLAAVLAFSLFSPESSSDSPNQAQQKDSTWSPTTQAQNPPSLQPTTPFPPTPPITDDPTTTRPTKAPTTPPTISTTPTASPPAFSPHPTHVRTLSPTRTSAPSTELPTMSPPTELPTMVPPTSPPTTPPTTMPMLTTPPTSPPPIDCSTSSCTWRNVGSDVDGPNGGDWFGYSVSFSDDGTRFVAGAQYHDHDGLTNRGLVQIYEEEGGNWTQIGSDLMGDSTGDYFGYSVSMSGDGKRVAVGATGYNDNIKGFDTGQTKVFDYNLGSWVLLGSPIIGEAGGDESGVSVSLSYDGNIVAIGADENDGINGVDSGHVRVYEFVSDVWTKIGDDIDGEAAYDEFGRSVSLSNDGNTVAIGASYNDGINGSNSGHTRVYKYSGSTWAQRGQDLDGEDEGDYSGYSISLAADGNTVAVGTPLNDNVNGDNSGHVRIYEYNSTTKMWSQLGDDIDGEAASDNSVRSVSLSSDGTIVAVGADNNDGNGSNSGHARIYKFDSIAWVQVGGDIDGESADDYSGRSVSLSGDGTRVVIGAPGHYSGSDKTGYVGVYELVAA